MSATVKNILDAWRSTSATSLGAGYQLLAHVYDVSKNNIRQARLAYGVRPLKADPVTTVNRTYTLDQTFEIILTDTVARAADTDAQVTTVLETMYNKADEIFKLAVNTHLALPTQVLNVFDPRLLEPEIIDGETKVVVFRMQATVKHRSSLT